MRRRIINRAVMAMAVTALVFPWGGRATAATAADPELRWVTHAAAGGRWVLEVAGLEPAALQAARAGRETPERWLELLSVHAGQGSIQADLNVPAMLGDYAVVGGVIRFQPRYPLERGVVYRAVFRGAAVPGNPRPATISSSFELPREVRVPSTVVRTVYPGADVLPENLLKFYVHFSAPMSRGHIYDHIHLLDEAGRAVELPFLEIDEELWNPTMTRLTLFIDPGRIKRGVKPLEEVGPALVEGGSFTLVIDRDWLDAEGERLRQPFRKSFRVGPSDRTPPDPAGWKVGVPGAGTEAALVVEFAEPMDHALAQRLIRVTDGDGRLIEGSVELSRQEQVWRFTPAMPWIAGGYRLVVPTTIEDLAGNNVGKPFEVDLFDSVQRRLSGESVKLPFEIH